MTAWIPQAAAELFIYLLTLSPQGLPLEQKSNVRGNKVLMKSECKCLGGRGEGKGGEGGGGLPHGP